MESRATGAPELAGMCGCDLNFRRGPQIPDQPSGKDKSNRNQLSPGQQSAKVWAPAAGIAAQELKQEACNPVQKQVSPEDLAVEFLARQHPGKRHKNNQLRRGLKQLCRLQRLIQWRADILRRQRVGESHAPEVGGRFPEATTGREAAQSPDGVAHSEAGR